MACVPRDSRPPTQPSGSLHPHQKISCHVGIYGCQATPTGCTCDMCWKASSMSVSPKAALFMLRPAIAVGKAPPGSDQQLPIQGGGWEEDVRPLPPRSDPRATHKQSGGGPERAHPWPMEKHKRWNRGPALPLLRMPCNGSCSMLRFRQ
jgi:hypothetical protein